MILTDYFTHTRREITREVKHGENRILDVGCGAGFIGQSLKESGQAVSVIGLEGNRQAAETAATLLDEVIHVDLDSYDYNDKRLQEGFDYIICADILEHLYNPLDVALQLERLLKPGGRLIVSVPNIRYRKIVTDLMFRDEWRYRDEGILDRTHVRFFTKKTITRLLNEAGFEIHECKPILGGRKDTMISWVSAGMLNGFAARQWLLVAGKR